MTPPPRIRFRDTTAAEITKITTHPATVITFTLTLTANTLLAVLDATDLIRLGTGDQPARLSDLSGVMFAPVYIFLVVPVYAAASEYQHGQIHVTLTAVPHRATLAASQLTAILAVTIPGASLALVPGRLITAAAQATNINHTALDVARWITAYALMSAIAYGLAGILRNTVAPLALLVLTPILIATGVFQWAAGVRLLPDQASLSFLGTPGYDITELPPMTAALVLTAWAVTLNIGFFATLLHRDA